MKRLFFAVIGLLVIFTSQAQINLAGTYEGELNDDITRKRMYLNIDFINGVPDFTQIFTTKESPMKVLPKDFMNSKKLKKNFAGRRAPGFARYNSKTLFSSTEEVMITNPRLEDGMLTAEWTNHEGKKGKCFIIANPDNTLQILGLTSLDQEYGPDNLLLTLAENKLPAGAEPYITAPDMRDKTIKHYCREILWALKVDSSKGLSGIKATIDKNQVRRIGNNILVPVQFSSGSKSAAPYFGSHNPFDTNQLATINGNAHNIVCANSDMEINLGPNETAKQQFVVVAVPFDAQKIDNIRIQGRSQNTHSTESNPYGDFEYRFSNIVLPELLPSNRQGAYIADSDLQLNLDNVEVAGKDLVIVFSLINHSRREKKILSFEKGIARTPDGDEYSCTVKIPELLGPGERVKGRMTIAGAGSTEISMARIPLSITERNLSYKAILKF